MTVARLVLTPAVPTSHDIFLEPSALPFARFISESTPITDSLTRSGLSLPRTITESAPCVDTATVHARSFVRTVYDYAGPDIYQDIYSDLYTAVPTDSVTTVTTFARLIAESTPITDTPVRALHTDRVTTDNAPCSDILIRGTVLFARFITDLAPISDAATQTVTFTRLISDATPISDALAAALHLTRVLTESTSTADLVTRMLAVAVHLTDSTPVIDRVTYTLVILPLWALMIRGNLEFAFQAQRAVTAWRTGDLFIAETLERPLTPIR